MQIISVRINSGGKTFGGKNFGGFLHKFGENFGEVTPNFSEFFQQKFTWIMTFFINNTYWNPIIWLPTPHKVNDMFIFLSCASQRVSLTRWLRLHRRCRPHSCVSSWPLWGMLCTLPFTFLFIFHYFLLFWSLYFNICECWHRSNWANCVHWRAKWKW